MKIKQTSFFLISVFLLITCNQSKNYQVEKSFYYWRSTFLLDSLESKYINNLNVKRLYIKFFDVDWNEFEKKAQPVAVIAAKQKPLNLQVIPTIFITNRTLSHSPDNQIKDLAEKIFNKIIQLSPQISTQDIQEIQLDCDWTAKTRYKYFKLIQFIDNQAIAKKIKLSATIRLHQIKYTKITGVPPVSRGMLMFYNMGNLQSNNTDNSILDLSIARQYIDNLDKYPLKLDVALPIFSWGVLSRRNRVINLIPNLEASDLEKSSNFILSKQNFYKVTKSHYLNGIYLYADDLIRIEEVKPSDLEKALPLLKKMKKDAETHLIFYHLDKFHLKRFSREFFRDFNL